MNSALALDHLGDRVTTLTRSEYHRAPKPRPASGTARRDPDPARAHHARTWVLLALEQFDETRTDGETITVEHREATRRLARALLHYEDVAS